MKMENNINSILCEATQVKSKQTNLTFLNRTNKTTLLFEILLWVNNLLHKQEHF